MHTLLLERTGGNPLYAEQFARMLAERDGLEDLAVPETVHALVAARLDTLRPELKALLHDAAVVGRVFWTGAVAAVGARGRDDVRSGLNELARREFVRPVRVSSVEGEDELSFWHALVRDVAYQQIPRAPRAEKHIAAARWVESIAGERLEDHAGILAHHYSEAFELQRALGASDADVEERLRRSLLMAGDRAAHLDTEVAERYFRRAVELAGDRPEERAVALARLAMILGLRGQTNEAVEAYEEAIPVLLETDEVAAGAALLRLGSAAWARGDTQRGSAAGMEAVDVLRRHPGPDLVRAFGSAGLTAAIAGRYDEARELLDEGFAVAADLGVVDIITLLQARASVRGYSGDARCIDDMREARDLGLRLGLGRDTAISMNNLGDAESWFLGLRVARETWEQAMVFSQERGLIAAAMWQRGERLRCLYHAGEWDDALAEAAEVRAWDEAGGAGPLEVYARLPSAGIRLHRGDLDGARAEVDALVLAARRSGDSQVVVPGLAMAALVESASGGTRRAIAYLEELDRITVPLPAWRSFCRVEPVRVAVAAGRLDLAEGFLDDAEWMVGWDTCARHTARAMLCEARGDTDQAAVSYREAAGLWHEYGSLLEQGYALLGLGRCGDDEAAREAGGIFERLGARPVLARAA
jgi:tetratricopeptide (TPR) repeat protein